MEFPGRQRAIGVLAGRGVYLLLRARSFAVILGLTLLSYAVNLFIFAAGRLVAGKPPLLREGVAPTLANYADPLPQALVLTAIVIGFAMTAFAVVLAMRSAATRRDLAPTTSTAWSEPAMDERRTEGERAHEPPALCRSCCRCSPRLVCCS